MLFHTFLFELHGLWKKPLNQRTTNPNIQFPIRLGFGPSSTKTPFWILLLIKLDVQVEYFFVLFKTSSLKSRPSPNPPKSATITSQLTHTTIIDNLICTRIPNPTRKPRLNVGTLLSISQSLPSTHLALLVLLGHLLALLSPMSRYVRYPIPNIANKSHALLPLAISQPPKKKMK